MRGPGFKKNVLIGLSLSCCSAVAADDVGNGRSVAELQAAMAQKRLSSESLVERTLESIKRNEAFNAYISVDSEKALARARQLDELRKRGSLLGPLHGIPVAVKDNIEVAGLPNTAGTPALRNFVPGADAAVIRHLKTAGAIVVGKTNMHELAYGITSSNTAFGAVGNAFDRDFFAGGSSGGTAAAVATGTVILGLGTDTGGSSRIPAALNGIVGFRPTVGRYPSRGLVRISSTRDTVGPMGRSVADVALLDSILAGETSIVQRVELRDIRFGVPRAYFYDDLEAGIASKSEELLQNLRQSGVTLVEADFEQIAELNEKIGFPVVIFETGKLLQAYIGEHLPGETLQSFVNAIASPDVKSIMQTVVNGDITEDVYREAVGVYRPQLQRQFRDYFSEYNVDAIVFPTTPLTARPIAGSADTVQHNGRRVPTFLTYIRNTDPGSNAGIPGLTIPLGFSDAGLPFGIEIDGPENSDRRLLAIGVALESFIQRQNSSTQ